MSAGVLAQTGYDVMLGALLDGLVAQLHLYSGDPDLGPETGLSDLTEVAFVGYAPVNLRNWTTPTLRREVAFSTADIAYFRWASGPASEPVRGCYVTAGSGGVLLWAWRKPGDALAIGPSNPLLTLLVTLQFPGAAYYRLASAVTPADES